MHSAERVYEELQSDVKLICRSKIFRLVRQDLGRGRVRRAFVRERRVLRRDQHHHDAKSNERLRDHTTFLLKMRLRKKSV